MKEERRWWGEGRSGEADRKGRQCSTAPCSRSSSTQEEGALDQGEWVCRVRRKGHWTRESGCVG